MNQLPKYSLIAAMDHNRVIGNDDKIPWKAKGEQALFKRITTNSVVIMGRTTYETLPNALPNRYNAVLTTNAHYEAPGCFTFGSFEQALISMNSEFPDNCIFVIGGAKLYEYSIKNAEQLHITRIEASCKGNVYFPEYDNELYNLHNIEWYDTNMRYTYYHYIRK